MRLLPLTTYAKALFMDGTLPIASNTAVRKSPTNAFRISRSTFFKLMMPQVMLNWPEKTKMVFILNDVLLGKTLINVTKNHDQLSRVINLLIHLLI